MSEKGTESEPETLKPMTAFYLGSNMGRVHDVLHYLDMIGVIFAPPNYVPDTWVVWLRVDDPDALQTEINKIIVQSPFGR